MKVSPLFVAISLGGCPGKITGFPPLAALGPNCRTRGSIIPYASYLCGVRPVVVEFPRAAGRFAGRASHAAGFCPGMARLDSVALFADPRSHRIAALQPAFAVSGKIPWPEMGAGHAGFDSGQTPAGDALFHEADFCAAPLLAERVVPRIAFHPSNYLTEFDGVRAILPYQVTGLSEKP